MNVLLTPNNTLIGRVLRLPLRLIPPNTFITVRGGINKGMKWRVGSSTHGCWLGTYEQDKQAVVRHLVQPGMKVIDVGANAGFYTLAFSRLTGASGHVWAIEPFAANVESLTRNVRENHLRNVTIVQAALSDCGGVAHFSTHQSRLMGKLTDQVTDLVVPTLPLDSLNLPVPDVVKIDVEGAELAALRGASRFVAQRKTIWLVALDEPQTAGQCRQLFAESGYVVQDIASNAAEIVAFPRSGE